MAAAKKAAETKGTGQEFGSRALAEGDTGSDVEVLQEFVLAPVTGTYDAATTKAVKTWQMSQGLNRDGVINARTAQRMKAAMDAAGE